MEPKFLRDSATRFKEHIERNYPHKDDGEYTRLIRALNDFINFGIWSDMDSDCSSRHCFFCGKCTGTVEEICAVCGLSKQNRK